MVKECSGQRPGPGKKAAGEDMPPKKKIVIVEDNDLYRAAVKKLIDAQDDMEVVAEAADGLEALGIFEREAPDLVLLDLRLPGPSGYEILRGADKNPAMKILVLTALESEDSIREALEAGAAGYCFKDVGSAELLRAIAAVLAGERYLPQTGEATAKGKRKEDREACDCSIQWAYFNSMDFSPGRLINCSRTGVFFETSRPVHAGSTVVIRLEHSPRELKCRRPDCLRSSAIAEVKWCRAEGKTHLVGARYHYPV
jgi:DNA-binding NarL/FixJ family response regulator